MSHDLLTRNKTLIKIASAVFVGVHVPLVVAALTWLSGNSEAEALLFSSFVGTVIGLVISFAGVWTGLRSTPATQT